MSFTQNRNTYEKKCDKIAQHYLKLAVEWKTLSKSILQNGITEDIRVFIDKRIKEETK